MHINEMLNTIQYITDNEGKRKAVLLDLAVWQEVVTYFQEAHQEEKVAEQTDKNGAWQRAMAYEEAAFHAMHQELRQTYSGQHVAIYGGKLVDYDKDATALYLRVREQYPTEFVLMTPIHPEPEETYMLRSPRLVAEA